MPTPIRNDITRTSHADSAAREAMMGALAGAAKWGIISALGAVGCYFALPLFRGLTIQFRVYLWMCPTTIGSMMEADRRLRRYEAMVRSEHRFQADAAREQALIDEMAELEAMERKSRDRTEGL